MKTTISGTSVLRLTILSGLILFLILTAVFAINFLAGKNDISEEKEQESFFGILNDVDSMLQKIHLTESDIIKLNNELDRLESRAVTVESWLSILKRRRALANIHPPAILNYQHSVNRAVKTYPGSQQITAIAAAALIKDTGINKEAEEQLRKWLPRLTDLQLNDLLLSFHVILGDLSNPEKAAIIPEYLISDDTEPVAVNLSILKTIRGNYRGAAADIHTILNNFPSVSAIRFAAEYHYDFGDLILGAELFSRLSDETSLIRQADALYLAGFPETAANIWMLLADLPNETSIYNLAVINENSPIAAEYLRKLVNMTSYSNMKSRQFGFIRYSRLLEYTEAISFLQNSGINSQNDFPFIDLEVAKRFTHGRDFGRQVPETWHLLEKHQYNEEHYMWAAWHFFFQRLFNEAIILLDRLEQMNITANWIDVYRAILLMNEGDLNAAEDILRAIPQEEADWLVFANLGRIYEEFNSPSHAIEQYSMAALNIKNPKTAARIQVRMARCYNNLSRPGDARRALEYAVELDPGNLTAKLELERL
ncbi:MAG: hypothetical protein FWD13_04895 [Treponema sp.]|nr:hypothetical protein [Treponema sp.]